MTPEMARALAKAGDQTISHEVQLGESYSILVGRRNLYVKYGSDVAWIPLQYHAD